MPKCLRVPCCGMDLEYYGLKPRKWNLEPPSPLQ
jgi:hypothetical protein